ncbi:hypothetical protein C9374_011651 [Naegleria lovaniensis]|uniref:Uncharacterized protein n=1 Tax=Naegleria lovaniensis TaxID=51637 RepID=A0AA88KFD7_NAELO|nr:uncharacterized protein C9374_011651 [Naegleria lovaniensis]KAG2373986.1 hypothetical protein C9374_011651 [Naegleria lovaniensis]
MTSTFTTQQLSEEFHSISPWMLALQGVLQSNKSTNSTSSSSSTLHPMTPLELYFVLNFSTCAPYIIIELLLFVLSIVIYIYKFKTMKRNQHVLFIMLFVLQAVVVVDLVLRVNNEANAYEYSRLSSGNADYLLSGIAVAHRCIINFMVFWQLWIMFFLCTVFLQICRQTSSITPMVYKVLNVTNITTIVVMSIFYALHTLYNIISGVLTVEGIETDPNIIFPEQVTLIVTAGVLFFASTLIFSILLNIISYKLEVALSNSVTKLKEMMQGNEDFVSKEIENSLKFKQTTLRKTRLIHAGLSIALLLEAFGFICISFYFLSIFFGFVYLTLSNFGIFIFISLLIGINAPMKEVQQFFQIKTVEKEVTRAVNTTNNTSTNDRKSTKIQAGDATIV